MSETDGDPAGGDRHGLVMAGWNLALRFLLELAALVGIAMLAWSSGDGVAGVVAVVIAPLLAATAWGVFNVPGDPSRSGRAPVTVDGRVRLVLELVILGLGVVGIWPANAVAGAVYIGLLVGHYAASVPRLRWLLSHAGGGGGGSVQR